MTDIDEHQTRVEAPLDQLKAKEILEEPVEGESQEPATKKLKLEDGTVKDTPTKQNEEEDDDEEDLFKADDNDENPKLEEDKQEETPLPESVQPRNVKELKEKPEHYSPPSVAPPTEQEELRSSVPTIPKKEKKALPSGVPPMASPAPAAKIDSRVSGSRYGLPAGVLVPQIIVESRILDSEINSPGSKLMEMLKSLPVNLVNDALTEYDDAVSIKGADTIRNPGGYLYGVVNRYVGVHKRAMSGEGTGILPMGEDGLTDAVQSRLDYLVASGFCTDQEMNEKVKSKIRMLSEKDALFALDELSSVQRSSIRNFGSYIMGILTRYIRGDSSSKANSNRGGNRFRDGKPPSSHVSSYGPSNSNRHVDRPQQIQWNQQPQLPIGNSSYGPSSSSYGPSTVGTGPPMMGGGGGGGPPVNQMSNQGMNSSQYHSQQQQSYGMQQQQQPPYMQMNNLGMNQGMPPNNQYQQQQQFVQQQPQSGYPQQQPSQYVNPQQQQPYGQFSNHQSPFVQNQGGWQQPDQQQAPPVDIMGLADKAASAIQALGGSAPINTYGQPQMYPPQQQGNFYGNNPQQQMQGQPYQQQQFQPQQQQYSRNNFMGVQPPVQQQVPPLDRRRRTTAGMHELPITVQYAVQNLLATRALDCQPDEGIMGMIYDLPENMALASLQKFAGLDKSSMRNKTAYLAGVLRRELEKINRR